MGQVVWRLIMIFDERRLNTMTDFFRQKFRVPYADKNRVWENTSFENTPNHRAKNARVTREKTKILNNIIMGKRALKLMGP